MIKPLFFSVIIGDELLFKMLCVLRTSVPFSFESRTAFVKKVFLIGYFCLLEFKHINPLTRSMLSFFMDTIMLREGS